MRKLGERKTGFLNDMRKKKGEKGMDDKNEENNKDEGIGDIIRRMVEKGILIDPRTSRESGKRPTMSDIFNIPCEEFMKHLKTFWLEPYNLAISVKGRMMRHLRKIK